MMDTMARERQQDSQASRPPAARRQQADEPDMADLLALQAAAGNRATGELVSRLARTNADATGRAVARTAHRPAYQAQTVQRMMRAPVPALSGNLLAERSEEGRVGNFSRARQWQVTNPQRGVIIQYVTRVFNVQLWNGTAWQSLADAELDAYVTDPNSAVHATTQQYWELWTVDGTGGVSDTGVDTFGLCSVIPNSRKLRNTTKGTFTITGTASFYPTTEAPSTLGFVQNAVAAAGGLFSRTTDPADALGAAGLAASGAPVTYTVTATWNSSGATTANDDSMYTTVA